MTHLRIIGFKIKELRATMQPTIVRFLRTRSGSCCRDFKSTSNCIPDNSAPFIVWHFYCSMGLLEQWYPASNFVPFHPPTSQSVHRLEVINFLPFITHELPLLNAPFSLLWRMLFLFSAHRCGLKCFAAVTKCNTFPRLGVEKFSRLCH